MNKTEAKYIHPPVESLHKENRDIRYQETATEEDNKELRRTVKSYQDIIESMENKITLMYEDGTLKITEAEVFLTK